MIRRAAARFPASAPPYRQSAGGAACGDGWGQARSSVSFQRVRTTPNPGPYSARASRRVTQWTLACANQTPSFLQSEYSCGILLGSAAQMRTFTLTAFNGQGQPWRPRDRNNRCRSWRTSVSKRIRNLLRGDHDFSPPGQEWRADLAPRTTHADRRFGGASARRRRPSCWPPRGALIGEPSNAASEDQQNCNRSGGWRGGVASRISNTWATVATMSSVRRVAPPPPKVQQYRAKLSGRCTTSRSAVKPGSMPILHHDKINLFPAAASMVFAALWAGWSAPATARQLRGEERRAQAAGDDVGAVAAVQSGLPATATLTAAATRYVEHEFAGFGAPPLLLDGVGRLRPMVMSAQWCGQHRSVVSLHRGQQSLNPSAG